MSSPHGSQVQRGCSPKESPIGEYLESVKITGDASDLESALTGASQKVQSSAQTWSTSLAAASKNLDATGKKMMTFGRSATTWLTLPLVGAGVAIAKLTADYQTSLNTFQAVTKATGAEMQKVSALAKQLGADITLPGTSAKDAAEAMTELAKGGLSVADSMAAARGVLQLAAAAQIDNATAATIAVNALNAFNLEGSEAVRVADLLAATANASSAEITDVAAAFQMASSVFSAAGISIEDLSTAIALMANAGIKGSDAGTSLKTMLLSLQAPTGKAASLMKDLGINIYDAQGQMLPFDQLVAQFSGTMRGLTEEERNHALAVIFGTDAVRAANEVLLVGAGAYSEMARAVTEEGAAADLAAAKNKGLSGTFDNIISQAETAAIAFGEQFGPAIAEAARGLAGFFEWLGKLPPGMKTAVVWLGLIAAAAGPISLVTGSFLRMGAAVGTVIVKLGSAYQSLWLALASVNVSMSSFAVAAAGIGLITFALIDAQMQAAKWNALTDTLTSKLMAGTTSWEQFSTGIMGAAAAINAPEWAQLEFLEGATKAWTEATSRASAAVMAELDAARAIPGAISPAIETMVMAALATGDFERASSLVAAAVDTAKTAVASSTAAFHAQRDAMIVAAAAARDQAGAAEGVIRAEEGLTGPTGVAAGAARDHAVALDKEALAAQNVADAMRATRLEMMQLAGGFLGVQAASLSLQDAQVTAAEAQANVNKLVANGKTGTAEYRAAVNDLAQANIAAVNAQISLETSVLDYTQTLADSGAQQSEAVSAIRAFGAAAGLSQGEIDALVTKTLGLIDAYDGIPDKKHTDITNTAPGAKKDVDGYNDSTGKIPGKKHTDVTNTAPHAKQLADDYNASVENIPTKWETLFPNTAPHARQLANDYNASIENVPTKWSTAFTANIGAALGSIGALKGAIASIDTYKVVTIAVQTVYGTSGTGNLQSEGGIRHFAAGGILAAQAGFIARAPTIVGEGKYSTFAGRGAEAIVPLDSRGIGILAEALSRAIKGMGGGDGAGHPSSVPPRAVEIILEVDGRRFARAFVPHFSEELQRRRVRMGV